MSIEEVLKKTKLSPTSKAIVRKAVEQNIEFSTLKNNKCKLSNGKKKYVFTTFVCSAFNSKLAKRVTVQKEVTSRLLRSRGFNAPENMVFDNKDFERAWDWAKSILPVVIKPYNGTRGNTVFINISDYNSFKESFMNVGNKFGSVLVEKMEKGTEYRFAYLKGNIIAVTKRKKANVIGDGVLTIKELIEQKNVLRSKRQNPLHKKIKINNETLACLEEQGYGINDILNEGEVVIINQKMNISSGAEAIDYTDKISQEVKDKVAKAAKSIKGLRVAGLDVLVKDNDVQIIEINSDPNLLMHQYPWEGKNRKVIEQLLDKMFHKL